MSTSTGTIPTGVAIASDALKYQGSGYTYGGNGSKPGDWDCSSYVSYVLGKDFGLTLPGSGTYGSPGMPPNAHGPVVLSYAAWTGATTLPGGTSPQAGDLCVFQGIGPNGHIGIAISSSHMVSALDSTDGTLVTPIVGYGPAGAPLIYRRINGAAAGGAVPAGSGSTTSEVAGIVAAALLGAAVPLAMAGVILLGALALGLIGAAAISAVISAAGSDG
jgi:cell wall-associated NlpC family hydrolase